MDKLRQFIIYLFSLEKKPRKGLLAFEWAMLAYLFITLAYVLVMYPRLPNAEGMIWGRMRILALTLALWGAYRLLPCGLILVARAVAQMSLLSWWYPDIYELNRILPNLDHLFAAMEQQLFHCQPALLFSQAASHPVVSELMCLGYYCYYPMMVVVLIGALIIRQQSFERVVFIVITTFFIHYIIFILLPVGGPQFYFEAVGTDKISQGVFPNLHDHFNHDITRMTCPGYKDGVFYALVEQAHQAGERPIAAFPSSHVSVCVVLMFCAWYFTTKSLFWVLMPFALLLCLSTVYIFAHYAIDVIAGFISGTLCWLGLLYVSPKLERTGKKKTFRKK